MSTLTTLMIDGISSHAMLLDSFVVLHAAFISSLHRLIGVEFGMNRHCRYICVLSLAYRFSRFCRPERRVSLRTLSSRLRK